MDTEEPKKTKQRILETSLRLFSKRGFSAVSVRDITTEVGVRESALYKHFPSKRAVFDQLLADYLTRCDDFMSSIYASMTNDPDDLAMRADIYSTLSDEEFLRIGSSVFTDFLMQPDVLNFWRMVSIERFRDRELAEMWRHHLFEEPIAYQTAFFSFLIKAGALVPVDPSMLALEFYTPLLLLYLQALPFDPDSKEFKQTLELSNSHMLHFRDTYGQKREDT